MVQLEVDALSMRFGRRRLFQNLSFCASSKEIWSITGINGAGKSSLVRILAGVSLPDAGTVSLCVDDKLIEPLEHPFQIGLVAPYLNLYEGFSLAENLAFVGKVRGKTFTKPELQEMANFVQLGGRLNDLVSAYSSGMKQRARLALALIHKPAVLILDEPTSNLDENGKKLVFDLIKNYADAGNLVIIATNEKQEAALATQSITL